MKDKIILKGQRIYLEPLVDRITAENLQYHLNDIELTRYMNAVPHPYTEEDANKYISFLNAIKNDESMLELGIFNNNDNEFIGVISLENIDFQDQNAELGYWSVKEYRGKGYIKEAAKLLILCFRILL